MYEVTKVIDTLKPPVLRDVSSTKDVSISIDSDHLRRNNFMLDE